MHLFCLFFVGVAVSSLIWCKQKVFTSHFNIGLSFHMSKYMLHSVSLRYKVLFSEMCLLCMDDINQFSQHNVLLTLEPVQTETLIICVCLQVSEPPMDYLMAAHGDYGWKRW